MSKSRDIADSAATINYIDNVTSDVQDQIDNLDPLPSQTGNAGNYLTTDGTTASWGEVSASPTLEAIASGTLANGDTVIINADGTVSAVSDPNAPAGSGSTYVFESAAIEFVSAVYDTANDKIVVAYADIGTSGYGTAVVGTVSGNVITFGTPVVYISSSVTDANDIVYDSSNNKVVVFCRNGQASARAYVGTVSGTSISFGGAETFAAGWIEDITSVFDTNANKIIVFFRDRTNSVGRAIVGTVSGTSISFGSVSTFNQYFAAFDSVFDSSQNTAVIAYRKSSDNSGCLLAGQVSGTSINLGSESTFDASAISGGSIALTFDSSENKCVLFYSDTVSQSIVLTVTGTSIAQGDKVIYDASGGDATAVYDSSTGKHVVFFRDASAGSFGSVLVGTVSGTTISFNNADTVTQGQADWLGSAYDPDNGKAIFFFEDAANSNYGTAFTYTVSLSNLLAENFIGISDGVYSDGSTAKVQIVGSVDDAQSGLTAGKYYYVQTDGTLSTTPAYPSVFAGTAVSATKLIVKG